ncbi:MAG: agmatinase [archaeon]
MSIHKDNAGGEVPNNFGGLPEEYSNYEDSKVVVVPVPYAGTVSYGTGTEKGPGAIIKASQHMELYDEVLKKTTCERGIHTAKALKAEKTPEKMVEAVYEKTQGLLKDEKFPVFLGGEHSFSQGAVKALKEKYSDLSVLQLDAHADLREEYEGEKFSHAAVLRRIRELGCKTASVGIRSLSADEAELIEKEKIPVFWAHEMCGKDVSEEVLKELSENVYITLDLDVFDPAVMPSTGTPEPGGLGWYDVISILEKVFAGKNVVGFDVVELAPIKELSAPDFIAAKIVYRMIGYKK